MRKRVSAEGDRIFKIVRLKIFSPGNTRSDKVIYRAPAGKGFTQEGIDEILESVADRLEKSAPDHEYKLVPTGPAMFNFVWAGKRATVDPLPTTDDLRAAMNERVSHLSDTSTEIEQPCPSDPAVSVASPAVTSSLTPATV